ncbi:MAG TPA: hypothetical protein VNA27_06055 [Rubrobacteraceae bacterium]|nr:hypothetical protein [Rubrobacteraceae bacterium]
MRKARKALAGGLQQQLDAILLGDLGAVNLGLKHQAFRIFEQVPLAPTNLLPAQFLGSRFAAFPGSLGRL